MSYWFGLHEAGTEIERITGRCARTHRRSDYGGEIWRETRYYAGAFEAPEWRVQWAERMEEG